MSSFTYNISYSKQNNNWSKGYLIVTPSTGWLWLKDNKKITINKGTVTQDVIKLIKENNSLICAGYNIKVEKLLVKPSLQTSDKVINNDKIVVNDDDIVISNSSIDLDEKFSSSNNKILTINKPKETSSTRKRKINEDSSNKNDIIYDSNFNDNNNIKLDNSSNLLSDIVLDPVLKAKMRPHQIEACDFLIDRLLGRNIVNNNNNNDNIDLSLISGAILADEMGTGKTLTSIGVLWSLCRHGRCKGIIVCPSSLIGNWEKEIKTWLPLTLGKSALYVTSNGGNGLKSSDNIVNKFCSSHPSIHPVIVISYEMFRNFSDAFNTLNTLEVLICDEGHRLKNAYGTKTSLALGNCVAMKRLVLTGTPIQNNLDELYSVVQFVTPGYLGTLQEFKTKYSDNIIVSRNKDSNKNQVQKGQDCALLLRNCLANILLRRTRDSILSSILPPRKEFIISCCLTNLQLIQYENEMNIILNQINNVNKLDNTNNIVDNLIEDTNDNTPVVGILPNLMRLRQISDITLKDSNIKEINDDHNNNNAINKDDNDYYSIFKRSGKIKVLESIVSSIKQIGKERVVIVSNFTNTLDYIQILAKFRKWPLLRLDGSVAADKRLNLVQHFNSANSPFFIMLLSAKAGGIGLNLIGGSRLILMEPDWNPATDLQAMGRIWREGQTKPCFIYRLLSSNTIDESIMKRQEDKSGLSSIVKEGINNSDKDNYNNNVDDNNENDDYKFITSTTSGITKGNILSLIKPRLDENKQPQLISDNELKLQSISDSLFGVNLMFKCGIEKIIEKNK